MAGGDLLTTLDTEVLAPAPSVRPTDANCSNRDGEGKTRKPVPARDVSEEANPEASPDSASTTERTRHQLDHLA